MKVPIDSLKIIFNISMAGQYKMYFLQLFRPLLVDNDQYKLITNNFLSGPKLIIKCLVLMTRKFSAIARPIVTAGFKCAHLIVK